MHGVPRSIPVRLSLTAISLVWLIVSLFSQPIHAEIPASAAPAPRVPTSAPTSVAASRQANNVVVITIDGPIDSITARSVRRRLEEAVSLKADAVVFDLNTPGGELGAVLEISNAIKQSPIRNSIAWIHPQAYSGGAIIALACRDIIVSDASGFGDAKVIKPVFDRASFSTQIRGMNDDERQKLLPPLLADLVDSARRHNRAAGSYQWDELLVQALVATDAELWWVQDNQTGVRFAVDRAEYERLFPDRPVLQPVLATASVGSNEKSKKAEKKPQHPPLPPTSDSISTADTEEVPFVPAAPSLTDLQRKTREALELAGSAPSVRPRTADNTDQRYTLLAKICNGDGAIVLHEQEMAYFQLASNVTPGSQSATSTSATLEPVNNDSDLSSFMGSKSSLRLDESWSEQLARFMSSTWVRGILLTIFLVCLFIEMFSPGITLPGAIAALCLVALFLPPVIVGMAMWWQLAAIGLGVLLLGAEIFLLPGFGIPGVLGLLALIIGMIGVFIPGSSGVGATAADFRAGLATGVSTLLLAGATTWITLFFIYRNITNIPALRRLVLQNPEFESGGEGSMLAAMSVDEIRVGDMGVSATPLRPAGKIDIGGKLHDVVAEFGFIDSGMPVRVVSVTAFRIGVDAVRDS